MRHRISLCALALTAVLAAGCGSSGADGPDAASGPRTSPASAGATPPARLCATVITKWARQIYDAGDTGYGDYQSMGLSNGQYMILRDILDAARTERRRESKDAGRELIARQAREKCAARYRHGGPSGGPWV
ncbi:hypothetical protein [Streptomyces sp. NPDC058308]|uniref:hypothetical protein n=1 Tax=Streptomyces sp. NPDC058308 TaxID=3346440 RepID=UPI0036EB4337